MKLAKKTAFFLFLIVLISPIYAEPEEPFSYDDHFDEWFFFIEELFALDGAFLFDDALMYDEDAFFDEEIFLSEELFPDEEIFIGEGALFDDEELFLDERALPSDAALLDEEIFFDEELFLDAEAETILAEDFFLDDDDFFFEAPDLVFEVPVFELRSFNDIFPDFSHRQRTVAFSKEGLRYVFTREESPSIIPNPDLEIDLLSSVMEKNPSHIIEALVVIPYFERELDLLDIYNALGRIENIRDFPATLRNGESFYAFTESTRIEGPRNRRAIPDPLPATMLPFSETMYIRLREISLGNIFLRGDISISMHGITYSMTNFLDVRYFIVPVVRAGRFATILYLEPIKEGILIYSVTGFFIPSFISDRVNLTPNINRRIEIFTNWITAGLVNQESASIDLIQ